jgi:hypothetical protein
MVSRQVVALALLATAVLGCGLVDQRPLPLARTCGEWSFLTDEQKLQTAEALIPPDLVASARARQHVPPEAADADVFATVRGSIDKVCELERRPGLTLVEITTSLYRQ